MAENTNISWCDHTINFWMGCTKISPACDGCYAAHMMDTRLGKVVWGGDRVRTCVHTWNDPLRWDRKAAKSGKPAFVFASSLADIFDNQVDPQWRADAFDVMRKTPNLVYLLLTKRPQNIIKQCAAAGGLPLNAAIGTTVEDQTRANINVPALIRAKNEVKPLFAFLSCEPLLGPIDLEYPKALYPDGPPTCCGGWECGCQGKPTEPPMIFYIDWVITGGETDQGEHKARLSNPDWFRSLRDQCQTWGVAYHHKQNGEFVQIERHRDVVATDLAMWPDGTIGDGDAAKNGGPVSAFMRKVGKKNSGRQIDGVIHDAFPEPRR